MTTVRLASVLFLIAMPMVAQSVPAVGTGTAEGRVLGPQGEPMVGVEVRAVVWPDEQTIVAKTRTDGDGMFVIGRLPLGSITLLATQPGHTVASGSVSLSADRPAGASPLRMWPANTLRGRVVDAEGLPVAGAVVLGTRDFTWFDGHFRSPETSSDAEGRFEVAGVPIGDCVLRAWAPGFVMKEQELVAFTDQEVDLRLERGDGDVLAVRVTGLPAAACATSRINFYPTRDGSGFAMPKRLEHGVLAAEGTWTIRGLPAAEWNVEPTVPGFAFEPRSVRTKQGQLPSELVFAATAVGSLQLRGVLRSVDGKPLAGEKLLCRTRRSQSMNGGTPGDVVTDAEGRFALAAPLVAGEPYSLHLVGSQWVLQQQKTGDMTGGHDARYLVRYEDKAEAARELSLVAVPAAFVTAKLVDGDGRPVPFAWTELQQQRSNSMPKWAAMAYATSRRDGTLDFPGVHGLGDELRVSTEGSSGAGASELFPLQPGERRQVLVTVSRPGSVKGRVLDADGEPVAGYRVSLGDFDFTTGRQSDGSWMTVPTDRDGHFVFVGVAPGGHKVHNIRDEKDKRPCDSELFEVQPGKTVELELRLGPAK